MVKPKRTFMVAGSTHIDLAWKKGRHEMAELFEVFVLRVLDLLDTHPDFKYVIEQAYHVRALAASRPDLFERLKPYLQEGRLEFVGGMVSTLETNTVCGEAIVRNIVLGMKWVKENLRVTIRTGWLVDTFGLSPQLPQLFSQAGITKLMASRYGSHIYLDHFRWIGIDGSSLLLAGTDAMAPGRRSDTVFFRYVEDQTGVERIFEDAARDGSPGPCMVMPYTENEFLPSKRMLEIIEEKSDSGDGDEWRCAVPSEWFDEFAKSGVWEDVSDDLNPEFSGTYSNRSILKTLNRRIEEKLLAAETWSVVFDRRDIDLTELWWELGFCQFHDVITGSNPTHVFRQTVDVYRNIETQADRSISSIFGGTFAPDWSKGSCTICAINSLPFERFDILRFPIPPGKGVHLEDADGKIDSYRCGDDLCVPIRVPGLGAKDLSLELTEAGPERTPLHQADAPGSIENEFFRVEFRPGAGITSILDRETGAEVISALGAGIAVQRDTGSYQIENPVGTPMFADYGSVSVTTILDTEAVQAVRISARIESLPWSKGSVPAIEWTMELFLWRGIRRCDVRLHVSWSGEESRVRFVLPTTMASTGTLHEIPFGIVERPQYRDRASARGEWPVYRFAAVDDDESGVGLVNTGCMGVENLGGSLWTTLLRAPAVEYVGMRPDRTSSQHGEHDFGFSIVSYRGAKEREILVRAAQHVNRPFMAIFREQRRDVITDSRHFISIDGAGCVLSSIKPSDGGDLYAVRFYESLGKPVTCSVTFGNASRVWRSDITERKGEGVELVDSRVSLRVRPFEIVTLLCERAAG